MRSDVLESTILGILQNEPTHGYDLRQQLASILGPFRALSSGSLYPCLKRMERAGLISRRDDSLPVTPARRSKIVYELTPAGTEHFAGWIGSQRLGRRRLRRKNGVLLAHRGKATFANP